MRGLEQSAFLQAVASVGDTAVYRLCSLWPVQQCLCGKGRPEEPWLFSQEPEPQLLRESFKSCSVLPL